MRKTTKNFLWIFLGLVLLFGVILGIKYIRQGLAYDDQAYSYHILSVGADETQRALTFYSSASKDAFVEYAKASEGFENPTRVQARTKTKTNHPDLYSHQAILTGLEPGYDYVYKVASGTSKPSRPRTFRSSPEGPGFSIGLVGDAQLGASGDLDKDRKNWEDTIKSLESRHPHISFILSLGDQVNQASSEEEYKSFIEAPGLEGQTLATLIGNHDEGSQAYLDHFNIVNQVDLGSTKAGSNYYFTFKNALFIVLNSNSLAIEDHIKTIDLAINSVGHRDVDWKIVAFHHSIYSTGAHIHDPDVIHLRQALPQVLTDYGIDLCLMGHDHVYTRTHLMDGPQPLSPPDDQEDLPSSFLDPQGVLYLTLNSSSGSKYYDLQGQSYAYVGLANQEYVKNYSYMEVDPAFIRVSTFRDDGSLVDKVQVKKPR